VAGTVLQVGSSLARLGHETHYQFAENSASARVERQMNYFRQLQSARKVQPDVAVIGSADGVLLPWFAKSVPLVAHSHGLEQMVTDADARYLLGNEFGLGHRMIREPASRIVARMADALVVQTNEQKDFAVRELKTSRSRVHVIPNGVDDDIYTIQPSFARPSVLWIASWLPRKGALWLPDIVNTVLAHSRGISFQLLGTGAPAPVVLDQIDPAFHNRVHVVPRFSRSDLPSYLRASTVGLSTSAFEGFGRAIVESMASGLPMVATKTGAAKDLIKSGVGGHLIDFGDTDGAVTALTSLTSDMTDAQRIGEVARSLVQGNRWSVLARTWEHLLQSVVADKGSS
jgi:glycosyltransferase involved in cell wall biosynthesis